MQDDICILRLITEIFKVFGVFQCLVLSDIHVVQTSSRVGSVSSRVNCPMSPRYFLEFQLRLSLVSKSG